jgi:membrane protease YdiL (CAAX protease family)
MSAPANSIARKAPGGLTPAPLRVSVPIFAATSLLFFASLYVALPMLRRVGASWFLIYNLVLALPMMLLVLAAMAAFRTEGRAFTWIQVRQRFRLGALDRASWLWTVALAVFMVGGRYSLILALAIAAAAIAMERSDGSRVIRWRFVGLIVFLAATWAIWHAQAWLRHIPLHSEPADLRDFLGQFGPATFMGIPLRGRWWVAGNYIAVLLAGNIAGEELWWRGYLLPRQELAHGKWAWLVHGVLWAAFHLFFQFTLWDMVRMMPTCCALAFVAQDRKNTWPGIVGHTLGNSVLLLQILRGIAS